MGKVILVTGAPGSGKSTLRDALASRIAGLRTFDYGQLLLRRKLRDGADINYEQLRRESAQVISPSDVATTDDWVIGEIGRLRERGHILIDSLPAVPGDEVMGAALRIAAISGEVGPFRELQ
jgi:adenylate kinase